MYTRKNRTRRQRGSGMFDFLTGSSTPTVNQQMSALKAKRNYNLKHSKSRVANVLGKPGQTLTAGQAPTFSYTNKQRIENEYKQAIEELKKLENPKASIAALEQLQSSLKNAIDTQAIKNAGKQAGREAGAVVITLPVFVAQILFKLSRALLAIVVFFVASGPSIATGSSLAVNAAAGVAPNIGFETTEDFYTKARKFTGANKPVPTVREY